MDLFFIFLKIIVALMIIIIIKYSIMLKKNSSRSQKARICWKKMYLILLLKILWTISCN